MTVFTDREVDLLKHRLAVPDALQDALADDEDDKLAEMANGDFVWIACTYLEARLEQKVPVEQIVAQATPLQRWILTDVIEGNTWLASMGDSTSVQERNGAARVAKAVVQKLRAAGLDVGDVPPM